MTPIVFSVLISIAGAIVQILVSQIIVRRTARKVVQDAMRPVFERNSKTNGHHR